MENSCLAEEDHDPGDKAAPVVPEEPAEGDLGEGEGQLQGHGGRRAGAGRGRDHADRPGGQDPWRHVQGGGPGAARRDGRA